MALAVAVLAATTVAIAGTDATASTSASAFVPMPPCRLMDTRPGDTNVGGRAAPLGAGETLTVDTWGTNGNCTIPSEATALAMNVVSIDPTASSYLTVFPADAQRPTASSLNWVAGQAPTPNSVTSAVSKSGRLSVFNLAGTVHLAVDVVGYYAPPGTGAPGDVGAAGPTGPAGSAGEDQATPANEIWVAPSGGDFSDLSDALASITDASIINPYVIRIAPGLYNEPFGVQLKSYVDLVGSGRGTVLTGGAIAGTIRSNEATATVRDLTVRTEGNYGISISNGPGSSAKVTLVGVTVDATLFGAKGIFVSNGWLEVHDVVVRVESSLSGEVAGVYASNSAVTGDRLDLYASTTSTSGSFDWCAGLWATNGYVELRDVTAMASGCADGSFGLQFDSIDGSMNEVRATADAPTSATGVDQSGGDLVYDDLHAEADSAGTGVGLLIRGSGRVLVGDGWLVGSDSSAERDSGTARLVDTVFGGDTVGLSSNCVGGMTTTMNPYNCA